MGELILRGDHAVDLSPQAARAYAAGKRVTILLEVPLRGEAGLAKLRIDLSPDHALRLAAEMAHALKASWRED